MNKLGLKSSSLPYSWRFIPKMGDQEDGAQIDLLFNRNDDAITLCEIKYTDKPYRISCVRVRWRLQSVRLNMENNSIAVME